MKTLIQISFFCVFCTSCAGQLPAVQQTQSADPSWTRDEDGDEQSTEPEGPVDNFELTISSDNGEGEFLVAFDGGDPVAVNAGQKFPSRLEPGEHSLIWSAEQTTPSGPDYVWHLDVVDCRMHHDGVPTATLDVDVDQAIGQITFTMPEEEVSCGLEVVREHFPNLRRTWCEAPEPRAMPNAECVAERAEQMILICPERAVLCTGMASGGNETWEEGDSELATRRMQACMNAVFAAGGTAYANPSAPLWGIGDERGRGVAMECYESGSGTVTSQIVVQEALRCTSDDDCTPGSCNEDSGLCLGPSIPGTQGEPGEGGIWDVLTFQVMPSLMTRDDMFGARLGGALEFDLGEFILEVGAAYGYLSGTGEIGDGFFDNTMLSSYLMGLYEVADWVDLGLRLEFEENRGLMSQDGSEFHDYRIGPAFSFHPAEDWTFEVYPEYVRTLAEDEGYDNGFNLGLYGGYRISNSFEIGLGYNWQVD